MKLSWKDIMTTLFAVAGGAVVYAKFYNYSWALIGSWRGAATAITVAGLGMFAFSRFEFSNMSWLNMGEMMLGVVAIGLAIIGMLVVSEPIFYILAAVLGLLWLSHTARHLRHNIVDIDTSYHHHAPVH